MQQYDVIIIGAGPAGLAAALYSARSKLKTLYIEKLGTGGQAATTDEIENYPGFTHGITGPDLSKQMEQQAQQFDAERLAAKVQSIELDGIYRIVKTNKDDFRTKTVIIASGAAPKLLGVPGELEFRARGVSYCATCDAAFYEGANIMVVGGGDSAVEEACYLTKFAKKVILTHRRGSLRAAKIVQERALANTKLTFMWNTVLQEIKGGDVVEKVILKNVLTGQINEMPIDGIFIYVGIEPNTDFVQNIIDITEQGYIPTDDYMRTNVAGIYAVGDVRDKLLRQVVTAVGDGATAAYHAEKYIEDNFPEERGNQYVNLNLGDKRMSKKLIEITKDNFAEEIKESPLPVLLDFWGPKCMPCLGLMPTVEELAETYDGKMKFCKLNTAENRPMAIQFKIMSIPTLLFFKNGEVIARLQGARESEEIEEKIKAIID